MPCVMAKKKKLIKNKTAKLFNKRGGGREDTYREKGHMKREAGNAGRIRMPRTAGRSYK